MTQNPSPSPDAERPAPAEVVCFGMIIPAVVMTVDELPAHNTGAHATSVRDFISDDAAIVATLLRGWDVRSGLIGTALGDDDAGRKAAQQLKSLGVLGDVRLFPRITTPFEVNVSDLSGARTYFWQRDPEILATLDTADLSLLAGARLLYVDWYDGDTILRPMVEARRQGIPVFLNLEYGHDDPEILLRYAQHATLCQVVTDPAQRSGNPLMIAQAVLDAGAETVVVTLEEKGCLVARRDYHGHNRWFRAVAPTVAVVDGCGAGATFSAGMIYGYLQGWEQERRVRFALAAASLKCTVVGPQAFPLSEIHQLASDLDIEEGTR